MIKTPTPPARGRRVDVRSRIATNVQRLRIARKWTVAELAQHAGLEPAFVAHLEVGEGDITLDDLFAVGEALGVDVSVLVARPTAH